MARRRPFVTRLPLFAGVLIPALLTSCGGAGPTLYPVRGKVFHLDKPAEGAQVVFHPVAGTGPKPAGVAAPDGSFTLSTHPFGDGAPAGEYTVAVVWYPANAREAVRPQNRLAGRYADAGTSGLRATVRAGPNELEPFRLTK